MDDCPCAWMRDSVNCETASTSPPTVFDRAIHHAGVVIEDPQTDDLSRKPIAILRRVVVRNADQHEQAGPDFGDDVAGDVDPRLLTRCTSALTGSEQKGPIGVRAKCAATVVA